MEEWKIIKAYDFCYSVTDGTHDSPKQVEKGKFLITSKHIKGNQIDFDNAYQISEDDYNKIIARSHVNQWDLIISMIGAYCGFCYVESSEDTDYAIKNVGLFKVGNELNCRWLYYYLNSPRGKQQLSLVRCGSSQPYISLGSLRGLEIPVPSNNTMKSIVSILRSLDSKIETNRKINENLEQQAQALFKSWLEGCNQLISIGELAENILDYTKNDNQFVRLINSSDVTEGVFGEYPLVENKDLKGHFKKRFQKGDILYSEIRPRNHHYGYVLFDTSEYIISTRLMVIRSKLDMVYPAILYQYLLLNKVEMEFTAKTEGRSGTFPQGTYDDMKNIVVPYSSNQKEINNALSSIRIKIFSLQEENKRLASLRDTLLPKLMSGEIKINP